MELTLPPLAKPSKIAAKDEVRPLLACGHVKVEGKGKSKRYTLEVTDSYKAAVVPLEHSGNGQIEEALIPKDALKALDKGGRLKITKDEVTVLQEDGRAETFSRNGEHQGQYPNITALVPPYADKAKTEPDEVYEVRFSAKYLWELAQSMGCDVVHLRMPQATNPCLKPIVVTPIPKVASAKEQIREGTHGLLMPVRAV